jgi:hypothetical protein
MDIFKIQTLIAQGRVIKDIAEVNPDEAFVQVGVYQPNNRKIGSAADTYPSFAIALSELGKNSETSHYLGEPYLGGVIFNLYKGSDGLEHGHVISLTEAINEWSLVNNIEGATSSWDGVYNTSQMVLGTSPAKTFIQTLGADWYLPSFDEMTIIANNRFYINKALSTIGGATIIGVFRYWTSSEYDMESASTYWFEKSSSFIAKKNADLGVRGIKSF